MTTHTVIELGEAMPAYSGFVRKAGRTWHVALSDPPEGSIEAARAAALQVMGHTNRIGPCVVVEGVYVDPSTPDGVDDGLINSILEQGHR